MIKRKISIFTLVLLTTDVLAVDPFSDNIFVTKAMEEEAVDLFKAGSEKSTLSDSEIRNFLNSDDYKTNKFYYVSHLDKDHESQAFKQFTFSPAGDNKNFSVNLYQGNWFIWGNVKLPFYLAYADSSTENEKEAIATSLLDKSDGLNLNFPFMWAMKSGAPDSAHKDAFPSLLRVGFNFRGTVKELEGDDKYTFGGNASFVASYSSFIELFSLTGENNALQSGYLTVQANYTIHKYKDEDIRNALSGLELLETDTYDSSFKSWGVKLDAQFGKLFNISYVYEKAKQPILGYEKISRLTLTKSF